MRELNDVPHPYAFVTMAYNEHGEADDVLWGALSIAQSLRMFSRYPLLVLTNTTQFEDGTMVKDAFAKLGARVLPCRRVELPSAQGWSLDRWNIAFWKLQIWQLTTFEKLVWLDTDALVFRSLDWMFDRDWMWAQRDAWFCDPDATRVCSGILLLYPDNDDFNGLLSYSAQVGSELGGADQQLIEMYFRNVKKRPVQLLSPLEASFGQCAGLARPPFEVGIRLEGIWNIPAFVHKSGGWGNTVDNSYHNVCFAQDLAQQLYRVGPATINICHDNPLAGFWRRTFCQAVKASGIEVRSTKAFCSDRCYYVGAGDEECRETSSDASGAIEANPRIEDYLARRQGEPGPRYELERQALYTFKYGKSQGTAHKAITFDGARLPPPPFTIVLTMRAHPHGACQEVVAWFNDEGTRSAELQLLGGDLMYGENNGAWADIKTAGLDLINGAWYTLALVRSESGSTSIHMPGSQAASGFVGAILPEGLGSKPRSTRATDCALLGEVKDLQIYHLELTAAELATLL